jgi:hypothetical protein
LNNKITFEKRIFILSFFFSISSETSIRLSRANTAASHYSERKTYLPNDVTLAELFKYEQSLAKEAAKTNRHIYSTTEF